MAEETWDAGRDTWRDETGPMAARSAKADGRAPRVQAWTTRHTHTSSREPFVDRRSTFKLGGGTVDLCQSSIQTAAIDQGCTAVALRLSSVGTAIDTGK
jgi:hypothetical protein